MEIQPGRPAAGRGGDAEWTGRQKPHNSGNEGGILLHTATESLKNARNNSRREIMEFIFTSSVCQSATGVFLFYLLMDRKVRVR